MDCPNCHGTGEVNLSTKDKPLNEVGEWAVKIGDKEKPPQIDRLFWESVRFMIKGLKFECMQKDEPLSQMGIDIAITNAYNIGRAQIADKLDVILQEMDRVDPKSGKE